MTKLKDGHPKYDVTIFINGKWYTYNVADDTSCNVECSKTNVVVRRFTNRGKLIKENE